MSRCPTCPSIACISISCTRPVSRCDDTWAHVTCHRICSVRDARARKRNRQPTVHTYQRSLIILLKSMARSAPCGQSTSEDRIVSAPAELPVGFLHKPPAMIVCRSFCRTATYSCSAHTVGPRMYYAGFSTEKRCVARFRVPCR